MPTGIKTIYDIKAYKGKYRDFPYDMYAVKLESKVFKGRAFSCLYSDLRNTKKTKTFISDTSFGCEFTIDELIDNVTTLIERKKPNQFFDLSGEDAGVNGLWSVDEVLDPPVPSKELNICYNHLKKHIATNKHLFIEKDRPEFVKEKHLGAFLTDSYYCEQYTVSNKGNSKENGGYPIAIVADRLENILRINLSGYDIDNIVGAFLSQRYILRDKDTQMIKKDLPLSPGISVPCYVLDIGKEVK